MAELSPKQHSMRLAIFQFKRRKGYSPTVRELSVITGRSVTATQALIDQLVRKGSAVRERNVPRSLSLT